MGQIWLRMNFTIDLLLDRSQPEERLKMHPRVAQEAKWQSN